MAEQKKQINGGGILGNIYIYDYTYSVRNIGHGFNICIYVYIMGYVSDIMEM